MSLKTPSILRNISLSTSILLEKEENQITEPKLNSPHIIKLNPIPEENESRAQSPFHRLTKDEILPKIFINTAHPLYTKNSSDFNKANHINYNNLENEIIQFLLGDQNIDLNLQGIVSQNKTITPQKMKYINEKDLYLGDLVLVFPNPESFPDHKTINLKKALQSFMKSFETDFSDGSKIMAEIFFKAFFQAFEKLKSNHSAATTINVFGKSNSPTIKQSKKKGNDPKNEQFFSNLLQNVSNKQENMSPTSRKRGHALASDKFKDSPKLNPKFIENEKLKDFPNGFPASFYPNKLCDSPKSANSLNPPQRSSDFPNSVDPTGRYLSSPKLMEPPKFTIKLKEIETMPQENQNLTESQYLEPLKYIKDSRRGSSTSMIESINLMDASSPRSPKRPFLPKPQKPSKGYSAKKEIKKEVMKNINKPALSSIEKINTHGGFLTETKNNVWRQNNAEISDFFSLMRNSILYKLAYEAGFKTRSFLDSKGEKIFTVLYSCDENLQTTAELDSFNKQVVLSLTDLLSLEPIDRKLRPIRLNILLREVDLKGNLDREESNYFSFVKPMIMRLLKEINYKRICRELQINGADDSVEIIEDAVISDELWKAYYEYLVFVKDGVFRLRSQYMSLQFSELEVNKALKEGEKNAFKKKKKEAKIKLNTKILRNNRRKLMAKGYEDLFVQAMEVVNSQYKKKKLLRTIWNHSKMHQQAAFFDYFQTPNNMSFRVKNKINAIWKRYQITEKGQYSLFTRMERLKLAYNTLQKFINVAYLIDNEFISEVFVINDMLALNGDPLKDQLKLGISFRTLSTKALTLQRNHASMKRIEVDSPEKNSEEEVFEINEVLQQTYNNLCSEWSFKLSNPIYVPVEKIRNYYGEKVALYFDFLSHYTKYLSVMAILGLIKTVLYYLLEDYMIRFIMDIFIGISLGVWSNAFVLRWRRKELSFAIKYGQLDFEQDEQERSLFQGTYQRSLRNDHMNILSYPWSKKYSKIVLAGIVTLILIATNMVFVVLFFQLVILLYSQNIFMGLNFLRLDIMIPAFLNNLLNQFFNEFFTDFARRFTKYENYRTLSLFEMSYITKKFLFSLIIMIAPLASISFLNQYEVFGFDCPDSCSFQLQIYLRTYYVFSFFTNLWEIMKPKFNLAYKNFKNKSLLRKKQTQEVFNGKNTMIGGSMALGMSPEDVQNLKNRDKFIVKANEYLEQEFRKSDYSESQDIYGTVEDYMEICLNYALLALFGIGDPLVFVIAFLSMIFEMQTDKHKLMKYTKRPIPLGERTIGIWLTLMEFICNVSVLTNSGIIAFTKYDFEASNGVLLFVILILISYSINWVLNSIFEEIPGNMARIMKRHKNLLENTVAGIGTGSMNPLEIKPVFPIFKVFNCKIINVGGEDLYEDVNNLDYRQIDKGLGEKRQKKKLNLYRNLLRERFFKEFRWNPHMNKKSPSIVLQELAHKKKRRSSEFRIELRGERKKLLEKIFRAKRNFTERKARKEEAVTATKPWEFLNSKSKQYKREELTKYLAFDEKKEGLLKENEDLFVDFGLNSDEFLIRNDLKVCLSRFSQGVIDLKQRKIPLLPIMRFHEIRMLEKAISKVFCEFARRISLKKIVKKTKEEECWIGMEGNDERSVLVKISRVKEESRYSEEFLLGKKMQKWSCFNEKVEKKAKKKAEKSGKIDEKAVKLVEKDAEKPENVGKVDEQAEKDEKAEKTTENAEKVETDGKAEKLKKAEKTEISVKAAEKAKKGFIRVRKSFFHEIESFDFFDEEDFSSHFLIEIKEAAEIRRTAPLDFKEISLFDIIEIRSIYNAFYSDKEILGFLHSFLYILHKITKEKALSVEILSENLLISSLFPKKIRYFLNKIHYFTDFSKEKAHEFRVKELQQCGRTLISMISLNKLSFDFLDKSAIESACETFEAEYPISIPLISKLLSTKPETYEKIKLDFLETFAKIEASSPNDLYFLKKLKKTSFANPENFSEEAIRAYTILKNTEVSLSLIKSLSSEEKNPEILLYESINLLNSEKSSLETLAETLMDYIESLKLNLSNSEIKELKVFYFLAKKAFELKRWDRALSNLSSFWLALKVNFLEENKPIFQKFYELQGKILFDANRFFEARKSFEKFLEITKENSLEKARILIDLAIVELRIGNLNQALSYIENSLNLLKKTQDPAIFLLYGFSAFLNFELGNSIKTAFFVRKAYKWLLKQGVDRDRDSVLRIYQVLWCFAEIFEDCPPDIRKILLCFFEERSQKLKGDDILEGFDNLIIARLFSFFDMKKSLETVEVAEKLLKGKGNSQGICSLGEEVKKKLFSKRFLSFVLELKSVLLFEKDGFYDEKIEEELRELQIEISDPEFKVLTLYNRGFLLFRRGKSKEASLLISSFFEILRSEVSLVYKWLLYDFMAFLLAFNKEKNSEDFWIEFLLEIPSKTEEFGGILNYQKVAINLILLRRWEKASGFFEFLVSELEKREKGLDDVIRLFDIRIFLAICEFHKGNFDIAKGFIEKACEMCRKEEFICKNEKIGKFFWKFFRNKLRKSLLLSNLAKINGFLDQNEKAYFIFEKCFRTLRKDFTHIQYSMQENEKNSKKFNKKKDLFKSFHEIQKKKTSLEKIGNRIEENLVKNSKNHKKVHLLENIHQIQKKNAAFSSQEEEILKLCIKSANPSFLLSIILNLVQIQIAAFKYFLALELLEKLEKVLEKLENPDFFSFESEFGSRISKELKIVGFFCKKLLIKTFFFVGRYDDSLQKLNDFRVQSENLKGNRGFMEKIAVYWYKESSAFLNMEIHLDFESSSEDFIYCYDENPRFFCENDISLLNFLENLIKSLTKREKDSTMLIFQIKVLLVQMKSKFYLNERVLALIYKALGFWELSQKKYFIANESFFEALKHAENTTQAKHLVGLINLEIGKSFYKQLKLLESEKITKQALEHFQNFSKKEISLWELSKIHYFLGKISIKFKRMIEENVEILYVVGDTELAKWEKHYVEIKLWEENQEMLKIFEEYRENTLSVFLLQKMRGMFPVDEDVINELMWKHAYKNSNRFYWAIDYLEKALMGLKGRVGKEVKVVSRIEERLIKWKYKK